MKTCPRCSAVLDNSVKKCPKCSYEFVPDAAADYADCGKSCPRCGSSCNTSAVFCPGCGLRFPYGDSPAYYDTPSFWFKVLAFLVPFFGIIMYIINHDKEPCSTKAYLKMSVISICIRLALVILFFFFIFFVLMIPKSVAIY